MVDDSLPAEQAILSDDEALELSLLQATIDRRRAKLGIKVEQADLHQRPPVANAIAYRTAALSKIADDAETKFQSAADSGDRSFFADQLFVAQEELARHLARFGEAA